MLLRVSLKGDMKISTSSIQYHGCWWTGRILTWFPTEYPNLSTRRIKTFNTLRPRQDGRHFPDDIFTCIFLNENEWHSIKISLKFVPKIPINNITALVQIMAWRRPGDKPLSEPMMVVLPTHICVTRPHWVKTLCCRETKNYQVINHVHPVRAGPVYLHESNLIITAPADD